MTCCFTGYRPEKFSFPLKEGNMQYEDLLSCLADAVDKAIDAGYDTFLFGGACGFDILAAEAVISIKQDGFPKLIAALPFHGQSDRFSPDWRLRYNAALEASDEIIYVSNNYSKNCFSMRNKYMVDNSDRVITYFDGARGGTANTLRYAEKTGKEIINIADRQLGFYF